MKTLVLLLLTCFSLSALATPYVIDNAHSSIEFKVRHFFGKVNGKFDDYSGEFNFDEKKPEKSTGKITIKTSSIDTSNEKRDKHLKSEDFFDADKYETITFEAKKFKKVGGNKYKLTGPMTIRGVTKDVTFNVEHLGTLEKDPWGNKRASFVASTKINRKDFGIVWNKTLDDSAATKAKKMADKTMIGDAVDINVNIEATAK